MKNPFKLEAQVMIILPLLVVAVALAAAMIVPSVISYHHVCFLEGDGVEVIRRSADSLDSQGKPLFFAKVGLPTEARLSRPSYVVLIDVPLNPTPVVFLAVSTVDDKTLHIDGENLKVIAATSGMGLHGYQYTFDVERADGRPLIFTVKDAAGNTLGTETLRYSVRSRGVAYGVDGT
jgi:hypothetical protein